MWFLLLACNVTKPTDADNDGWLSNVDCNDDNPNIHPAAEEIPGDGTNNDCNLDTRDDDYDQDGLVGMEDCDDGNAAIPGPEVPYDGLDNDCDPSTPDDDLDQDGVDAADDCDDTDPEVSPNQVEVPYDGKDNDCDVLTPDGDGDGDGVLPPDDCDDANPDVQGPTTWYEDCDGDGFAPEDAATTFACQPAVGSCGGQGGWTSIAPTGTPSSPSNDRIDCADRDPLAFPGQTQWFDQPVILGVPRWDFDCDGEETAFYGPYSCERIGNTASCNVQAGFLAPVPGCGDQGLWSAACVVDVDVCEHDFEDAEIQQCR